MDGTLKHTTDAINCNQVLPNLETITEWLKNDSYSFNQLQAYINHLNNDEEVPMKGVLQPSSQPSSLTQEFIEAVKPLIFFLRKNRFHPHTKVIVEDTGAEMVEGMLSTGVAFDNTPDQPLRGSVTGAANATLTDQDLIDNPQFKDAGFKQGDSVLIYTDGSGKLQATGTN